MNKSTTNPTKPQANPHHRHPFRVQTIPKEHFVLFERSTDAYIYEKKFYNNLPPVVIPPKSFHFPNSLESFSSFDIMTMTFGLKKNQEILTDPRMNTKIHKDFIDNSLGLIFPEQEGHNHRRCDAIEDSAIKLIKNDILKIIESKEETEKVESHDNKKMKQSFYLRAPTLMSSTFNLKRKNSGALKSSHTLTDKISNVAVIRKQIDDSFQSIKKIEEGMEHPYKKDKGIYAKNVYDIKPFFQFGDLKFGEVFFPNDPMEEIEDEYDQHKILIDKFLLRPKEGEIYNFYKREKFLEDEEGVAEDSIQHEAEYFSHEREYTVNTANPYELFNRHLMFLNRKEKCANFAPVGTKLTLKKYKKTYPPKNEDEYMMLTQKRERDVVIVPEDYDEKTLNRKNNWFKDHRFNCEVVANNVGSIDMSKVDRIRKFKYETLKGNEEDVINEEDEEKQQQEDEEEEDEEEEDNLF